MSIRFQDIGQRLKAFRIGAGLSADELAKQIGISRAALYRYEKGEVAKVDTLERISDVLGVSVPNLLGVGMEYVPSAIGFFERMRQIEADAERIIVLFGPVSYLLTSDAFDETLRVVLKEGIPEQVDNRTQALAAVDELMEILLARKRQYRERRPAVVSLISGAEFERFLRNGLVGTLDMDPETRYRRRVMALREADHIVHLMEEQPIGVQIGVVLDTMPNTSFQIFGQTDRALLAISPFRLGEQPNIRVGVALITAAPEAIDLHQRIADDLWSRALKGPEAARYLRGLIDRCGVREETLSERTA
ncbi:helix-turn-helix transcriptional regulator [Fodinicurvata sp. EGI_FJ10296]|uniref:helix-turn-helix domain-containing protein n=1 Tax=Fodinicurvata sp. EGI_FJ10296 TaxID=3231908 RepID=UPI0034546BBA